MIEIAEKENIYDLKINKHNKGTKFDDDYDLLERIESFLNVRRIHAVGRAKMPKSVRFK